MQNNLSYWPRAIVLVDMNAFFASVEQYDNPELRGKPVAVTNGEAGTCIITCSYEARTHNIKTGMRLKEAYYLCPDLVVRPSRPKRYAEISSKIMHALLSITPDVEIFSIDEAFLDITRCQKCLGHPETIGRKIKQIIFEISGLLCSIGISGDKTTAKYAAKCHKPNGFTVVLPWEAEQYLANVPVSKLCGIGEGITKFLANYGVYYCGNMKKIPISILGKRFGHLGRRIWLMCQGQDPDKIHTDIKDPKSMGHGKVLPPHTKSKQVILTYLYHMCLKLGARLRAHHFQARHFFVGWKNYELGWLGGKCALPCPSNDSQALYEMGKKILNNVWNNQEVYQIQLTALDPQLENIQKDLFTESSSIRENLYHTIDKINDKYGEFAIAPAPLLNRSKMHNVISPSWKPSGHRQSI